MKLSFRPATDADDEFAFELRKATEHDLVTQTFGWDEALQRALHRQEWKSGLPTLICADDQPIGTYMLQGNRAAHLYQRFGFQVYREDAPFVYMKYSPVSHTAP
ncbi:hypothetical protein [Vibrio furnissii]|uniref:hypothetical protein n=1 Tax=Vibrio furnissii TaxID=29494 RepID=UPI001EEB526A|nr:hypothetical protein [Vibrio furnissii]MCG6217600.1 hypothetical protein [Vibrio furnissii]